jgi:omega-amidase
MMPAGLLNISIIQPDIVWENKDLNLKQYEAYIANIKEAREVIVLPEMFSTGFSMAPEKFAEPMDGASVSWMAQMATKYRCILAGSLMIEEDGAYYNRLLWVQPDGQIFHYDKRHLFAYADENKHYSPGNKRLIVQVKGFRICLQVCYDLRFPVWARNNGDEYDVLLYVANWPERRSLAWKTLLQARAIENISYVVGVNRVGTDDNNISYSGDSRLISPLGEIIWDAGSEALCSSFTLDKLKVTETRAQFPFLNDADKFLLL